MATFDFYQDKKIEIRERTFFTVDAETEAKAIKIVENQNGSNTDQKTGIEVGGSEILFESSEQITMEDNGGFATLEIYINNGNEDNLLYHNGLDTETR